MRLGRATYNDLLCDPLPPHPSSLISQKKKSLHRELNKLDC